MMHVYQQYRDITPINHGLLIAGTFLHDIGKLRGFILSEHELVKDYSTKTILSFTEGRR